MNFRNIFDISVVTGALQYPGDPPFIREIVSSINKGAEFDLSKLSMSAHSGTHLDAPAHYIAGGKTLDQFAAEEFTRPVVVIDINDPVSIKARDVLSADILAGDAVLFKTNNSKSGLAAGAIFSKNYVYLAPEAADALIEKRISIAGIDYLSIDGFEIEGSPCHKKLLGAGILILESIDLADVPPGRYTLICPPLKIRSEGAPTRAILIGD